MDPHVVATGSLVPAPPGGVPAAVLDAPLADTLHADLNPRQRQAAQWGQVVGGRFSAPPLLVLAGAGTGKTATLAHRVAHLVAHGVDPSRILLLTFSRRAAQEMTHRAGLLLGAGRQDAARHLLPWAGTFHSIGARLLRQYADLLGLPANTAWIDVPSPFAARQLSVRVARHISTRWADRSRSLAPIVDAIAGQFAARPGLYLAFFSSYDYLDQVFALLREQHPDLPCWEQQRQMPEAAREAFLARFMPGEQGVGFAVLGGAFAEGIDLPGERLIGAFIATLGLPQVNPVNEQIRARMEAVFAGRGYDYTYLYPGLQKVVQAAGRVIRSPADEGVLVLMDDRFSRAEVRALLPAWWEAREPGSEQFRE